MNFFLTVLIHSADLDNDEFIEFCKTFNIKFVTFNDVTNIPSTSFNSIYISTNFTNQLTQEEFFKFINTHKNLLFFKQIHIDASSELNTIEVPNNINYVEFMKIIYEAKLKLGSLEYNFVLQKNFRFRSLVGSSPAIQKLRRDIDLTKKNAKLILLLGEKGTNFEGIGRNIHYRLYKDSKKYLYLNTEEHLDYELKKEKYGIIQVEYDFYLKRQEIFEQYSQHNYVINSKNDDCYLNLKLDQIIKIPALMDRKEDIQLLMDEYFERFSHIYNKKYFYDAELLNFMKSYHWPGNEYEFTEFLSHLLSNVKDDKLNLTCLPVEYLADWIYFSLNNSNKTPFDVSKLFSKKNKGLRESIEEYEISYIKQALVESNGVVSNAAKLLGLRRTTLIEKMRKYQIKVLKNKYNNSFVSFKTNL